MRRIIIVRHRVKKGKRWKPIPHRGLFAWCSSSVSGKSGCWQGRTYYFQPGRFYLGIFVGRRVACS